MAQNPYSFVLAFPLRPGYLFSKEELMKMEGRITFPPNQASNREVMAGYVLWTCPSSCKKAPLWTSKAEEGLTVEKNPKVMGGMGTFWPVPLAREGEASTYVWKTSFPEGYTSSWVTYLGKKLDVDLGRFWTMSRK